MAAAAAGSVAQDDTPPPILASDTQAHLVFGKLDERLQ